MNNKSLLIIVILLLVGIAGIMLVQVNEETPAEEISSSISEMSEEVGDEIDDATTGDI